jgi:hypothetical protein
VDLFVLKQRNVKNAADAVVAALEKANYAVDRRDEVDGLGGLGFEDASYELAQLIVTRPDDDPDHPEPVMVEISHFYYSSTVRSPIGPVLSLDDLAGWKTCALGSRRAFRDPVDVASFVAGGYEPARLIGLAMARDSGLEPADFAEAAVWVDDSPDDAFIPYLGEQDPGDGGEVRDVAWLRRMFADWPREPLHAE